MDTVDTILQMFAVAGQAAYFGESVSQTEHALQSAHLAAGSGADEELIVAALLHDVGHLLSGLPEDVAQCGVDDAHENAGAAWLEKHFGPAVVIRCGCKWRRNAISAVEPDYLRGLSSASQLSLRLQGGPFTPADVAAFEAQPHFRAAIALALGRRRQGPCLESP